MSTHTTFLTQREEIVDRTIAIRMDKPPGFAFKAGQAIDLVLPGPSGIDHGPDARHTFSIVSAPFEPDLVVATRMRDTAFKRALGRVPIGTALRIEGPFGSLTLHGNRARPALFIAGGIGITPFVSILRQAVHEGSDQRVVLLYANRSARDAVCLRELQALQSRCPHFQLIATMTRSTAHDERWSGATGRFTEVQIRRTVRALASPVCYVVGPPLMVHAMRQMLAHVDVDDDDIRSEEFYGY